MTLDEFDLLEKKYKIGVTLNQAVFLDHYISKLDRINIYALDLFFVELIYDINYFHIKDVRCFKYGKELDKYVYDFNKWL